MMKMYLDAPNKIFTFDHSTQAVSCDRKLWWSKKLGIKKKKAVVALHFGRAVHKFVEGFWLKNNVGDAINDYLKIVRDEESPIVDDVNSDENRTVQRGLEVCSWYAKHYELQRGETQVMVVNGVPLVEVSFALIVGQDHEGWTYMYCGRIDRVEIYRKDIRIVDTKTTTRMGKTYWNMLRPNDQFTGYWVGIQEFLDITLDRFILDCIYLGEPRKADDNGNFKLPKAVKIQGDEAVKNWMRNVSFEQGPTRRSKQECQEWKMNTLVEGIRLRKLFQEPDQASWTRRTSQCNSYGECPFRDLCNLTENHGPVIDALYTKDDWNPLAPTEVEEIL